jgi:hypothetical protein
MVNEVLNSEDYDLMTEAQKIELAMRMIDWLLSDATAAETGDPHKVVNVLRGILADLFPERSTND